MADTDRIEMLTQFLQDQPNDAFARYGLAMEYSKLEKIEPALAEFRKLLELHPDYTAGYFMAAQTLAKAGRMDEARQFLEKGISIASQTGNQHAKTEMQAMLDELG